MRKKRTLPELGTDRVLAQILHDPKSRKAFWTAHTLERFRPCEVDGESAFFHRWVEEDRLVVMYKGYIREDDAQQMARRSLETGLFGPGQDVKVITQTFALVEMLDGSVKKVESEKVRFCDREEEGQ